MKMKMVLSLVYFQNLRFHESGSNDLVLIHYILFQEIQNYFLLHKKSFIFIFYVNHENDLSFFERMKIPNVFVIFEVDKDSRCSAT